MIPIPTEILTLILNFVGERGFAGLVDWESLSSCSRVCRGWKPVAQAVLCKEQYLNLAHRPAPCKRYIQFLRSSPSVAAFVRVLHIYYNDYPRYSSDEDPPLKPYLLFKILRLLPRLHTLDVKDTFLAGWPWSSPLPRNPIRLRSLRLEAVRYHPRKARNCVPFDFLSLFEVDDLESSRNSLDQKGFSAPSLTRREPACFVVRELKVSRSDPFVSFNHKHGGLDCERIQRLCLKPLTAEDVSFHTSLVRRYGPHLSHLELKIDDVSALKKPGIVCPTFDIASCLSLETLKLSYYCHRHKPTDERYSEVYRSILAATSTSLRELTFNIVLCFDSPEFCQFVAPMLAPVIVYAATRFPELETILLVVPDWALPDESVATMEELLPENITKRGLVQFTFV
ncbi:hypothetical protein OH77DRAFT_803512 [Trametes cingulata]|nr:hypothetical protein OH77DRAFT_803512 [Trametes cingulata]